MAPPRQGGSILADARMTRPELQNADPILLARAVFDQAAVGIAISTLDGRLVETNQKACEILGYTGEELRARTFLDLTHPEDIGESRRAMRRLVDRAVSALSFEKR